LEYKKEVANRMLRTSDENELELDIIMSLAGVDETVGYQVIVPDNSLIQVVGSGWSQSSISGNAQQYLNDQEIASAAVYENSVTVTGGVSTIKIERQSTTTQRTMTLTIISKSTGAYKHFNLTLPRYPV
jgi:hypothetical protein